MGRWLCLLAAGIFLVTGCGFSQWKWPGKQEKPRFAVVDWDSLEQRHPKYKKWKHRQETLDTARWLRNRQLENGRKQLDILNKFSSLKNIGQDKFQKARWAARMAEKRTQENDLLKKKREALGAQAEARVKQQRDQVEEQYKIPLFNLRLKLSTIKMTDKAQKALLAEQAELLEKRRQARAAIDAQKEQWLQQQLAPDIAASQARLDAYAKQLARETVKQKTGLSLMDKGEDGVSQPGKPELDKLIASMDKQIESQESEEKRLKQEIDSDILSALKKVNLTRKYTLIFRNPKANISADDITEEVNAEVQKIVY